MMMALPSARLDRRPAVVCAGRRWSLLIATWAVCIVGCAQNSAAPVHGKVTLDGESIAAGNIAFLPTAGSGRKAAAAIEQGVYSLTPSDKLSPGTYRVEISWPKPTGRKIPSADPGMQADEMREAVPAKYNSKSELTVEVRSGDDEKDFALSSN